MRLHLTSLLAVVACFAAPSAFAQWLPGHDYVLDRSGNVIYVRGPSITTPAYTVSGGTSGAVVTSQKAFDVAGRRVAIEASKTIPWKSVAMGAARAARVTPYSMAAGFAVEWLVNNGWKYVPCLNNASTCDSLVQWQKKETRQGTDLTQDYQAQLPNAPWRGTIDDVVNSDIKPHLQASIAPSPGTPADQVPIVGAWKCNFDCSTVLIDVRTARAMSFGVPLWEPGYYSQYSLNKRAKEIPVGPESWTDSPPPDFDKDPPAAPDPGKAPGIWDEALPGGIPDTADPPVLSGPPSVSGPSSSSQSTPGGSSTSSTTYNFTYNNGTVTITQTTTTSNSDGSTTTTQSNVPADKPLCGVPGYPSCKVSVDEAGTPEWKQPDNSRLDEIKAADAAKMNEVARTIPVPDLGWFGAPPLAACRPYPLPNNMGAIDACGVVDSVRSVMAYLWALVAAWMAFGWIRQAVNGG